MRSVQATTRLASEMVVLVSSCLPCQLNLLLVQDHLVRLLTEAATCVPAGLSLNEWAGSSRVNGPLCRCSSMPGANVQQPFQPKYPAVSDAASSIYEPKAFFVEPQVRMPTSLELPALRATVPGESLSISSGPWASQQTSYPFYERPALGQVLTAQSPPMGGSLLMVERQAKQVQVHFPPPQGELTDTLPHASDEGQGFSQFISLFRKEMSMMQHQESRAAQFIPSIAAVSQMDATQKEAGDDIFLNNLHSPLGDGTEDRDDKPEDDYDYW